MEFTKDEARAYLNTHAVHPGEPAKIVLVETGATGAAEAEADLRAAATVVYSGVCIDKIKPAPVVAGAPKKATKKVEEPVEEHADIAE